MFQESINVLRNKDDSESSFDIAKTDTKLTNLKKVLEDHLSCCKW